MLHRVVEVLADSYVICGDNCIGREHDITDADVLGVLTGFYRGETQVNMQGTGYRCYVRAWCGAYPARRALMRLRRSLGRVKAFVLEAGRCV